MDLKAVVISGEAPESDDDASNIVTVRDITVLYFMLNFEFNAINIQKYLQIFLYVGPRISYYTNTINLLWYHYLRRSTRI